MMTGAIIQMWHDAIPQIWWLVPLLRCGMMPFLRYNDWCHYSDVAWCHSSYQYVVLLFSRFGKMSFFMCNSISFRTEADLLRPQSASVDSMKCYSNNSKLSNKAQYLMRLKFQYSNVNNHSRIWQHSTCNWRLSHLLLLYEILKYQPVSKAVT